MKIFLNLITLVLISSSLFAQLPKLNQADSLKQQLTIAAHDTSRVIILAELGEAYRYTIPDTALLYGQRSLSMARQIKFYKGEAIALLCLSVVMRELGNFPTALETALKALQIAQDKHYIYLEELSLVRIAIVHVVSKNFRVALTYFRQAEKKLEISPHDFASTVVQVWSGSAYEELNKLDSALYYLQLASPKVFQYETLPPQYFRVLGNIQAKLGNSDLALEYYRRGIQIGIENKNYRDASSLYISIASLYKNLKQTDSAIHYAKQGLDFGQILAYKNRIMDASNLLAELYEQKDVKTSLEFYKMSAAARDSMYSVEQIKALQSIEYTELERQREIEATKAAYQAKAEQFALISSLSVFLIIAIILFHNNRQKQKANKILEETLFNLKSTQTQLIQSEKMASLGQLTAGIAHEIQNPLNFVNNFSEVSVELMEELKGERLKVKGERDEVVAEEIIEDVIQNLNKITHHGKRADAIVKGMLQHSRTSSGEKVVTDINALADEYLRLSSHGMRAKDKSFCADYKTDFDLNLPKVNVVPQDIGRLLLNIINNAFYACAERSRSARIELGKREKLGTGAQDHPNPYSPIPYSPLVQVSTRDLGNKIEISISDNGPGIPDSIKDKIFQPFFTTKPTGEGTGLGLSLSYDIVKAHGGELKFESQEGNGSVFIISLPLN